MISLAPHSTDRADAKSAGRLLVPAAVASRDPECFGGGLSSAEGRHQQSVRRSRWATIYASLENGPGRL